MDYVLETVNINKYFYKPKEFHVLKNISFGVQKGEFASIMGKSGSGKSTLLYILSTMDTDYKGQLYLNNDLITGKSQRELAHIRNKNIGFVFQFHYLLSEFSVLENVMLPAKKLGEKSPGAIERNARQKLDMLHIGHLAQQRASRISGGEKQRVAIARALINDPTILMGDEPTGNLDSQNAENVFNIFKTLREEQGLSLLVVTHDEDFAKRTDRIVQLANGEIITQ